MGLLSLVVVSSVFNVLRQLLFKNPNEPPVVFHWFPFIGSTVTFGMDPFKFFFNCREKVCYMAWDLPKICQSLTLFVPLVW